MPQLDTFIHLMQNRLLIGAFRYGPMADKLHHNYRMFDYLIIKLKLYANTGNTEMLVDVANMAMLTWLSPPAPRYLRPPVDGWAWMRDRLLTTAGVCEFNHIDALVNIRRTEWSSEFETYLRAEVTKLQSMRETHVWKSHSQMLHDFTSWYYRERDRKLLVAVAGASACEFLQPEHPKAHWAVLQEPTVRCPKS